MRKKEMGEKREINEKEVAEDYVSCGMKKIPKSF